MAQTCTSCANHSIHKQKGMEKQKPYPLREKVRREGNLASMLACNDSKLTLTSSVVQGIASTAIVSTLMRCQPKNATLTVIEVVAIHDSI